MIWNQYPAVCNVPHWGKRTGEGGACWREKSGGDHEVTEQEIRERRTATHDPPWTVSQYQSCASRLIPGWTSSAMIEVDNDS